MANPGPATTISVNSTAVMAGKNTNPASNQPNQNQGYQGQNALRCLGVIQGVNLNALGDTIVPIINSSRWSLFQCVITNASISLSTVSLGVFTAPAAGGTGLSANATQTGATGPTVVVARTVTTTAVQTAAQVYINVATAQGAAATADIYLYGYDFSPVVTP